MRKTKLYAVLVGAAALMPLAAGSHAVPDASEFVASPLGLAIASQGNQALRTIRGEAAHCLRTLKPAPLETLIQKVDRKVTPTPTLQSL